MVNSNQQDAWAALEINLGHVALNRAKMFELLTYIFEQPTNDFAAKLINGEIYNNVSQYTNWVNQSSGIFSDSMEQLKDLFEIKKEHMVCKLIEEMDLEYDELLTSDEKKKSLEIQVLPEQLQWIQQVCEEKSIQFNSQTTNQFKFECEVFKFLCELEGNAWLNSQIEDAKYYRRKEREFVVTFLGKNQETGFFTLDKEMELIIYPALIALGRTFLELEKGF